MVLPVALLFNKLYLISLLLLVSHLCVNLLPQNDVCLAYTLILEAISPKVRWKIIFWEPNYRFGKLPAVKFALKMLVCYSLVIRLTLNQNFLKKNWMSNINHLQFSTSSIYVWLAPQRSTWRFVSCFWNSTTFDIIFELRKWPAGDRYEKLIQITQASYRRQISMRAAFRVNRAYFGILWRCT